MPSTTNNNTVTVDMTNLSATERAQLVALMEKANAPVDNRFTPAMGAEYHDIDSKGAVHICHWDGGAQDTGAFAIGNCFPTKADAQFARDALKIKNTMRAFAAKAQGGADAKFYIFGENGQVKVGVASDYTNDLRFATKELAEKAIESVGADNVKKYYLGM